MKCITMKTFLIILFCFFITTIFITIFLTDSYHKSIIKQEINEIEENLPKEEFLENDSVLDEKNYQMILNEKYQEKKILALTFDDGPSKYTYDLIDALNKRNIQVTFFVLGESVEKYPEALEFAIDSGNEIGIHSYKHKLFTKLTPKEIKEQITKTKDLIYQVGQITPNLIRVPYGSFNKTVSQELEAEGLTSILWDVDTLDWKFQHKTKTYTYALKKIKGNDIILMHDSFKPSVEAAISLVDQLSSDGYIFVTISTLLELRQTH